MMEKMIDLARGESTEYVTKQKYPHIAQLIAAYKVGQVTKDTTLCKSLFPCDLGEYPGDEYPEDYEYPDEDKERIEVS